MLARLKLVRTMSSRWALIFLILAGFLFFLHDLEAKSLWSDEALTLHRARQPIGLILQNKNLIPPSTDYHSVPSSGDSSAVFKELPFSYYLPLVTTGSANGDNVVATPDLHPPLYFLFLHPWIRWAGESEFALRFPSAVGAILAVPLAYVLGRRLRSTKLGLWAALFIASSPFHLWYAQEARMYTWVVALSLASVYSLLLLLEPKPRHSDYLLFGITTLALIYTHFSGALLLTFELIVYAAYQWRRRMKLVLALLLVLGVVVASILPAAWQAMGRQPAFGFSYRPIQTMVMEAWSAFSLGLHNPPILPLWQIAPFVVLALLGVVDISLESGRWKRWIPVVYLILPIVSLYGLSVFRPSYMNPRHLAIVSPAWALLMARGLLLLRRRAWPIAMVFLILVLALRVDVMNAIFNDHEMRKDDIRGLVQYIESHAETGDGIVLHHPVIPLTFNYYYDGPYPQTVIPRYGNLDDTDRALTRFQEWSQRYDRLWFVYGPPPPYFPHDFLPDWADANLFKVAQREFEAWWTYVAVAAYDDAPPLEPALPAEATATQATWDEVSLEGFAGEDLTVGKRARLNLFWQAEKNSLEQPLALTIRLVDPAGVVWLEKTRELLPFYPVADWPVDKLVRTEVSFSLPQDLPPITYDLELGPIGLGEPQVIGQIELQRSESAPPASNPRFQFGDDVALLDADLASGRFRAGHPLHGTLTWQAMAAMEEDYRLHVRLVDLWGRVAARNDLPLTTDSLPTSAWQVDDRLAGHLRLPLPADLKGGLYRVRIGLKDADGAVALVERWSGRRDWATIKWVRIDALPMKTSLPAGIEHPLEGVRLAEDIYLRGYDLEREGHTLSLTLYWQAEESLEEDYHVFVHVGEPGAAPVAQADGVPVDWLRPTSTWRAGEVLVDSYEVSLADLPPGRYSLLVGLYDPQTGQRPTTIVDGEPVAGGYVTLQEVEVAGQ